MRMFTLVFVAALAACSSDSATSTGTRSATESPREQPWTSLFDGKTLAGWVNVQCAPSTFTVRDGMLVSSGVPTGILRTARMYENFELELEWRHMKAGGNAGLFIWSDALTARGQPFSRSIEVQVMDGVEKPGFYTSQGDIFSIHGSRMKPDRPHPNGWERCLPSSNQTKPSPEWNHYRLVADQGVLKLSINGVEVSGASACTPRKGYICIESEGSECHFRNLKLKERPASATPLHTKDVAEEADHFHSLYDGVSLTGWKDAAEKSAHWQARDWTLSHDGKGGDLWTAEDFGDFELLVDWRLSAAAKEMQRPVLGPDGLEKKLSDGKPELVSVQDAGDSGIYLRGSSKAQVNIWCWPCGSGETWGYRTAADTPASERGAYVPLVRADAPPGQWNRFHIRVVGETLDVLLNGKHVIKAAHLAGVPSRGPIGLQSHGDAIEFANIYVNRIKP